jgi:hypothetical protein
MANTIGVATSNKTTAVINANDSAIRFTPTLYSAVGKRFQKFLSQTGHIINNPIQGLKPKSCRARCGTSEGVP